MGSSTVKRKKLGVSILAVGLSALLFFAACAPASTLPVEKKMVEIGHLGSLTGGAGSAEQKCLSALLDYVKYFNEEESIPGVTIKLSWVDIGGGGVSLAHFISAYNRFKESDIQIMYSNSIVGLEAFKSGFERDKIPLYAGTANEKIVYPPAWYYFRCPTYAEQFAVFAEYIMENWEQERPPRLAFITSDSVWGRDPLVEGTKYAQSLGIEMLPTEWAPFVILDASTQLLRLKERGADFAYIQGVVPSSGPILRDAERLGLVGQIQFAGVEWSVEGRKLIDMAGFASEGYIIPGTIPTLSETEIPGIKLIRDKQMKYHGELLPGPEYVGGWIGATITCEAITRAIEEVGYENLNGPAFKEAFDSIKDFDVYGLVKITYTPENHEGSNRVAIYQIRGGEMVRVSDWLQAPMLMPQE